MMEASSEETAGDVGWYMTLPAIILYIGLTLLVLQLVHVIRSGKLQRALRGMHFFYMIYCYFGKNNDRLAELMPKTPQEMAALKERMDSMLEANTCQIQIIWQNDDGDWERICKKKSRRKREKRTSLENRGRQIMEEEPVAAEHERRLVLYTGASTRQPTVDDVWERSINEKMREAYEKVMTWMNDLIVNAARMKETAVYNLAQKKESDSRKDEQWAGENNSKKTTASPEQMTEQADLDGYTTDSDDTWSMGDFEETQIPTPREKEQELREQVHVELRSYWYTKYGEVWPSVGSEDEEEEGLADVEHTKGGDYCNLSTSDQLLNCGDLDEIKPPCYKYKVRPPPADGRQKSVKELVSFFERNSHLNNLNARAKRPAENYQQSEAEQSRRDIRRSGISIYNIIGLWPPNRYAANIKRY